jgi:hypothetical protein
MPGVVPREDDLESSDADNGKDEVTVTELEGTPEQHRSIVSAPPPPPRVKLRRAETVAPVREKRGSTSIHDPAHPSNMQILHRKTSWDLGMHDELSPPSHIAGLETIAEEDENRA